MKTITIDDNLSILELMRFIMNRIDPAGSHFFASSAADGLEIIGRENIRVIFLDIEMPGLSGDDAARHLLEEYGKNIDIIIITGHEDYAMLGHRLHCSGFVTKPFGEKDISDALKWLRVPAGINRAVKVRCGKDFSVSANGKELRFSKGLTFEMFAYLVYKNGAFVTNGELLALFWGGDTEKQDLLRKYIKDMRDTLENEGVGNVLIKSRGKIALDMSEIETDGDIESLEYKFGWYL